jgi:hypothetical protein
MGKVKTGPRGGLYILTKNGNKKYLKSDEDFCGPSGGAGKTNFPVNTEKRCRAALSYSRFAPKPCGIVECALKKAEKKGWKCGAATKKSCRCGCSLNK